MLGVECGRTFSPCPHPHSSSGLNLTLGENNDQEAFSSLTHSNSQPSIVCSFAHKRSCSSSHMNHFPVHHSLTHRNFWVFPHRSFPCGIVDAVAVSFPHGLICGSCIVVVIHALPISRLLCCCSSHAQIESRYFSLPLRGLYVFSQ